jgi:hypothetical protein
MNWLESPAAIAIIPLVASILLLLIKSPILKLPAVLQPIVPILTAGLPVLLARMESGDTAGVALIAALVAGLEAIGIYHAAGKVRRSVAPPGAKTIAGSAVVSLLVLSGCAASFEESKLAGLDPQTRAAAPPPSDRCMSLDSAHRTWGAIGKGAAVLAGAEGIATWPVDSDDARIGLAVGAGVTAAVAATAVYVSEDYGSTWARECQ